MRTLIVCLGAAIAVSGCSSMAGNYRTERVANYDPAQAQGRVRQFPADQWVNITRTSTSWPRAYEGYGLVQYPDGTTCGTLRRWQHDSLVWTCLPTASIQTMDLEIEKSWAERTEDNLKLTPALILTAPMWMSWWALTGGEVKG